MPVRYHIIISPEAAGDLQALHDYISQDSPRNAGRIVERILKAISALELFPHRNLVQHKSKKIRYPVRSLGARPYLIYFRVIETEQVVRILTVRHGARQRPRRFG
jgi:toxin ParE1/3/4